MTLIASDHFRIVVGLGKSGMSLVRFLARQGLPFAVVDTRANLLQAERLVSGDKYIFIRNAYLQSREFKVKDGQVEDDF